MSLFASERWEKISLRNTSVLEVALRKSSLMVRKGCPYCVWRHMFRYIQVREIEEKDLCISLNESKERNIIARYAYHKQ